MASFPRATTSRRSTRPTTPRTAKNVVDSDATLIFCHGQPTGGTLFTQRMAEKCGRPCLVVDLDSQADPGRVLGWLAEHQVQVLNVAGPRESQHPGIGAEAYRALVDLLGGPQPV